MKKRKHLKVVCKCSALYQYLRSMKERKHLGVIHTTRKQREWNRRSSIFPLVQGLSSFEHNSESQALGSKFIPALGSRLTYICGYMYREPPYIYCFTPPQGSPLTAR